MPLFKKSLLFLALAVFIFPAATQASGEISVNPPIISEKAASPDILEYGLVVKNNTAEKRDLYVIVRDVVAGGEKKYNDPSELPLISSLTRWIEISRGVIELSGGEERTIPLTINVPSEVAAGFYHAAITFAQGGNRTQAEAAADEKNEAKLIINLEIEKHEVEKAEVTKFTAGGSILTGKKVNFSIKIRNVGNKEVIPEGEIVIYDRGGRIIETLKAAEPRETIYPGSDQEYLTSWEGGKKFGKFKAKLLMYYGAEKKDLQDVLTFVLIPLPLLIILAIVIVMVVALFSYFLLRRNIVKEKWEEELPESVPAESSLPKTGATRDYPAADVADPRGELKKHTGRYIIDLKKRR